MSLLADLIQTKKLQIEGCLALELLLQEDTEHSKMAPALSLFDRPHPLVPITMKLVLNIKG